MFLTVVFCWLTIAFILLRRNKAYPPGRKGTKLRPFRLPIVGNLISVQWSLRKLKYHHLVWQAWSNRYGKILGLQLGQIKVVVLFGKELIKEVSSREVFSGRPDGLVFTFRSFGKRLGLVFSDGAKWQATRRVVLKYLKSFGYGTGSMEAVITKECQELVNMIAAAKGRPAQVNNMFDVSIINILWGLVAGRRYDLRDERVLKLCSLITRLFRVVDISGGVLTFLPWVRHILPTCTGYSEMAVLQDQIYDFIKETIEEHRETININHPRDVIDTFLIEMIKNKEESFTEEELQVVCLDLLEAGMETVSSTLTFTLLHILVNPEVQRRMHKEIDQLVGSKRAPALCDRARMAYSEAVVLEGLRISTVPAVGIPHRVLESTSLGKYTIPKGTYVLLALHDLHNGVHWTDPKKFRPERFLTPEGNLRQDESLMPFGTGKRRCIGEGLARSELFLFLTHLLQRFELQMPEGEPPPSLEPIEGVTLSAQPFRVAFKPRL